MAVPTSEGLGVPAELGEQGEQPTRQEHEEDNQPCHDARGGQHWRLQRVGSNDQPMYIGQEDRNRRRKPPAMRSNERDRALAPLGSQPVLAIGDVQVPAALTGKRPREKR